MIHFQRMLRPRMSTLRWCRSFIATSRPTRFLSPANTENKFEDVPSTSLMPSRDFIKRHIRGVRERDKLAQAVTELQLFLEFYCENPIPPLTDEQWATFLQFPNIGERSEFLLVLQTAHKSSKQKEQYNHIKSGDESSMKISERNQLHYNNGEMVYAPGFHNLIELRGQDFRGQIDKLHGARLLANCRTNLSHRLLIDCRFMTEFSYKVQNGYVNEFQDLCESNWTSRQPFDLSFVNLKPDKQLSELMKKSLLFLYGPPRLQNTAETFAPHPLGPTISTRGLKDVIKQDGKESIIYVSWRANRFLPDVPPMSAKTVVLCASTDYQPWSSSVSAAQSDGLNAYRIPLEKHVVFDGNKKILPLRTVSSIMSSWMNGDNWHDAISQNIVRTRESTRKEERIKIAQERELLQRYKLALNELTSSLESQRRKVDWNPVIPRPDRTIDSAPVRKHRYSREERNARRAEASR